VNGHSAHSRYRILGRPDHGGNTVIVGQVVEQPETPVPHPRTRVTERSEKRPGGRCLPPLAERFEFPLAEKAISPFENQSASLDRVLRLRGHPRRIVTDETLAAACASVLSLGLTELAECLSLR
jgi:hypothetical protein